MDSDERRGTKRGDAPKHRGKKVAGGTRCPMKEAIDDIPLNIRAHDSERWGNDATITGANRCKGRHATVRRTRGGGDRSAKSAKMKKGEVAMQRGES